MSHCVKLARKLKQRAVSKTNRNRKDGIINSFMQALMPIHLLLSKFYSGSAQNLKVNSIITDESKLNESEGEKGAVREGGGVGGREVRGRRICKLG